MKFAAPLFVIATLLAARAPAQDASDAAAATADDKPYASIVARNMFGLLPIPPPDTNPPAPPVDPPPKITPNGIMDIFGRLQALFKVANKGKPGQPPKDDSYVLAEGERQDDIEVVKINKADSIVTFNNHGTLQELALVPAKDSGSAGSPGGAPGGPGGPAMGGGRQTPMSPAERAAMMRDRMAGRVNPNFPGAGMAQPNPVQPGIANSSYVQPQASQPATIEDQVMNSAKEMAQIELNRIATQEAVDKGLLPPLPPTPLTPPDATAHDGFPLIVPANSEPEPRPNNR
jgi:hypothetical protein